MKDSGAQVGGPPANAAEGLAAQSEIERGLTLSDLDIGDLILERGFGYSAPEVDAESGGHLAVPVADLPFEIDLPEPEPEPAPPTPPRPQQTYTPQQTAEPSFPVPLHGLPEQVVSVLQEDQLDAITRPDTFFVPVLPGTQRSERLPGLRTEPETLTAIRRLVESGKFGWGSTMDFMTWAVYLGVQVAGRALHDEQFSNELVVQQGVTRRHQRLLRETRFWETLDMIVTDIGKLIADGDTGEAKKEFRSTVLEIGGMNIPSLREKMLSRLAGEFPMLWGEMAAEKLEAADLGASAEQGQSH